MLNLKTVIVLPLFLAVAAVGCDSGSKSATDKKGADAKKGDAKKGDAKKGDAKKGDAKKGDAKKGDDKKAEPAADKKPEAPAVEVSEDMKKFMAGFDGTNAKVEAQLKAFAASDEIKDNDMGMYNLKDPKVVAATGDCFTFEAGSGMTVRTYDVCWEGGKIKSIADKGMK